MKSVRLITDLDQCRDLWRKVIPQEQLSDLWEIRDCFQREYNHRPCFLVAEEKGEITGFLPLSWNEEAGSYLYFPGETWEGKTWLEQNRLTVKDRGRLKTLLGFLPRPYNLRYLQDALSPRGMEPVVDEIGYYFYPPDYNFEMDRYYGRFSHKSHKRLIRELSSWESRGVEFRYDEEADFQNMIDMNLTRYGSMSYFHDGRFLRSFRSLYQLLCDRGWSRLVAVLVEGRLAAVDMGAIFNSTYTLLAGGTSADFPGVAKLINLYHMQWACQQKLDRVDFLCGDFNWKTLFHLTPRPLYLLSGAPVPSRRRVPTTPAFLTDTGADLTEVGVG